MDKDEIDLYEINESFAAQAITTIQALEINPDHEIVIKMKNLDDESLVEDISNILLEEALLAEGIDLKDPAAFVKRLNRIMTKAV